MQMTMDFDEAVETKRCYKCGEVKPRSEFYKDRSRSDGLDPRCKSCTKAHKAAWRKANPEKHREGFRKWAKANPEKHRERKRKWRKANPEKAAAQKRRHNRKRSMERSSRVREIVPEILRLEGDHVALEQLAHTLAKRKDFRNLCWMSADIEDLAVRYYYKEEEL